MGRLIKGTWLEQEVLENHRWIWNRGQDRVRLNEVETATLLPDAQMALLMPIATQKDTTLSKPGYRGLTPQQRKALELSQ